MGGNATSVVSVRRALKFDDGWMAYSKAGTMLANIHLGVDIILWEVLTQAFVWPIGSAISGNIDEPLLS